MAQPRAERLLNLHILLLGARALHRQGRHPARPATPTTPRTGRRRGLRAGLRARQGRAAPARCRDRGRQRRRVLRRRARLPHPPRADLAARDPLRVRRGRRARPGHPGLAARHARQGDHRALAKLKGQGVEIDPSRLEVVAPAITADEPAFERSGTPLGKRRQVSFHYQRAGETEPTTRRLQPWGVARSSGRWYVVGFDIDRGAERVFRLSRIVGPVRATGKSGAYDVPPGTDVRALARRLVAVVPRPCAPRSWCGRAPASACAGARSRSTPRRRTDAGLGPRRGRGPGARARRRGADLRPRRRRRGARGAARRRGRRGCAPSAGGARDDHASPATPRPTRSPGCWPWCPTSTHAARCASTRPPPHFGTDAEQVERDLRLLFMSGARPGLPDDLIDVDLDALEGDRIIRVDNADYLARPVRLLARRGDRARRGAAHHVEAAPDEAREVVDRTLAKLEAAAGQDGEGLLRLHVEPDAAREQRGRAGARVGDRPRPPGRAHLPRAVPRRGVRPGRRPARAGPGRGPALPRRLVPHRRRRPGRSGSTGSSPPRELDTPVADPGARAARPDRRLVHRRRDHAPSPCASPRRRAG